MKRRICVVPGYLLDTDVWMDAYLAAFAIRSGHPFATLDADFRRFEDAGLQLSLLSN
jgi:predicted nucleic acid-binding protein